MQNLILLILGAIFVYLLFFRKGGMGSGMGMGCCGGHGGHGRSPGGHLHDGGSEVDFFGLRANPGQRRNRI